MACLYVCLLALLWRTPVRRALSAVFEPLGRMALTCYVTASFVMVPAGVLLDSRSTHDVIPGLIVAAAVLPLQWVFCRLWLSRLPTAPWSGRGDASPGGGGFRCCASSHSSLTISQAHTGTLGYRRPG